MPPEKGWMSCSLNEPGASAGVADFHIFLELLVSDRASFGQQRLDLLEDKSVAFDGRGMVGLLAPAGAHHDSKVLSLSVTNSTVRL
jgi:hypothetical protein